MEKFITQFKTTEKNDRSPYLFSRNGDLHPLRGSGAKEKPPFFNVCALMMRKIMHSRDAQCNTGE